MADEIEILFHEVDSSGDGTISLKELGAMFKKLGIKATVNDVKKLIYQFDKDGSRKLDIDEFRELISSIISFDKSYSEAYEVFKAFDKDGNNTVSIDEVKEACKFLPTVVRGRN